MGQVIDEPDAPDPCACAAQAGLIELLDRIVGGLDHRCGGLRSTRMRILRQVVGAGRRGAFQTDLADRLHVSHPAMSKICDELERESLVRRQPPPFDRRKKAVLLTDKGEAQVHTCASALNEAGAAATAALTAAELLTLERLLEKVMASRRSMAPRTAPTARSAAAPDATLAQAGRRLAGRASAGDEGAGGGRPY